MAHLLGSEFIIAHLRSDVLDIQATLKDIMARTSRCNVMSWKFPDRLACDIDIPSLMEQYDFSPDPESNQVAHIVLLELVIDRFYLLSHCLTRFLDLTISAVSPNASSQQGSTATTSVGITVLKHWNKVMQINAYIAQLANDLRMNRKKLKESESEIELTRSSTQLTASNSSLNSLACSTTASMRPLGSQKPPLPPVPPSRSSEAGSSAQGCQTVETAFSPCSSCHEVQSCLKEVSKMVMSQCQKESLPTNLFKYCASIKDLETAWLDKNEIVRWKNELRKDLQRLQKHFESLAERNRSLTDEVERAGNQCNRLQQRVDGFEAELQREAGKQARLTQEHELRMQNLMVDKQAELQRHAAENRALTSAKQQVERELEQLQQNLERQKVLLKILDRLKVAIKEDDKGDFADLEMCVVKFRERIKNLEMSLNKKEAELSAENAKAASFEQQIQAMHGKQEKLMARLEEMTCRGEELQEQLDQTEDEVEQLSSKLKSMEKENLKKDMEIKEHKLLVETITEERELLARRIHELELELKAMEETTEHLKQEQRLLLEYPDLNGPVNSAASEEGNVLEQMSSQVKANEVRIRLLGQQTEHLRETITKIMTISGANEGPPPSEPSQPFYERAPQMAWTVEESFPKDPEPSELEPEAPQPVRLWQLPPRPEAHAPSQPQRAPSRSSARPPSAGGRPSSAATASLRASRAPKTPSRTGSAAGQRSPSPVIQWSIGSHTPKRPPSFVCPNCGRCYKSGGELAMHNAYCGR